MVGTPEGTPANAASINRGFEDLLKGGIGPDSYSQQEIEEALVINNQLITDLTTNSDLADNSATMIALRDKSAALDYLHDNFDLVASQSGDTSRVNLADLQATAGQSNFVDELTTEDILALSTQELPTDLSALLNANESVNGCYQANDSANLPKNPMTDFFQNIFVNVLQTWLGQLFNR